MKALRSALPNSRLKASAAAAILAAAVFALSFASGLLSPSGSSPRTLSRLRKAASAIKAEFGASLRRQDSLLSRLTAAPAAAGAKARFERLQSLDIDFDVEGAVFADPAGKPVVWLGNVLDPATLLGPMDAGGPACRIVMAKASAYLVLIKKTNDGWTAVFRLLAFIPQLKSRYLEEYQFLPDRFRSNSVVVYYDFREDVAEWERFFARNNDEFIGQPRLQGRIQSLFFPLRDGHRRIAATVNVSSPSPDAVRQSRVDAFRLAAVLLFLASLILAGVDIVLRPAFRRRPRFRDWGLVMIFLASIRVLLMPLGRLRLVQAESFFSPAAAGFRSFAELTRSPADIFASALVFSLAVIATVMFIRPGRSGPAAKRPAIARSAEAVAGLGISVALYPLFHALSGVLVRNSNVNLLDFQLRPPFLLLQLSLLFVWLAAAAVQFFSMRRILRGGLSPAAFAGVLTILEICAFVLTGHHARVLFILQILALAALAWAAAHRPRPGKAGIVLVLLAQAAFLYGSQAEATAARSRMLAEKFLKNNVLSLEPWARFLLEESFPELDRNARALVAYFRRPEANPNTARELWAKTLPAKFNWYSSLDLVAPGGALLSRFSLNIPKMIRPDVIPMTESTWTLARVAVPFMGREREFLAAVRDWSAEGKIVGRTILSLSLDPEMLPFLYSANPYFELLRVNTIPSLNSFDLRFAVFDRGGQLLFNPFKLSAGLPSGLLENGRPGIEGTWTRFLDKGRRFDLFAFSTDNRIYAVFVPRPSWRAHGAGAVKLAILYGLALGLPLLGAALLSARRRNRPPLWSFADRVHLSFMIVALVPLLLFGVFSRNFFGRLFAQQFVEKAEIHADLARHVLDDFLTLQKEDRAAAPASAEDLVLLLSNTIANDVNLYTDGRLAASSRREFVDAGILPDLLDGEVYFRLGEENNPYFAKERRIGRFALRTLTVPYIGQESRFFLSLPFPFEQQDIANATQELIEFLVFLSVFFFAVVLLLARGIGSSIVTPVRRLLAGTREASLGNLEIAIAYDRRDEMKTLVDGFNMMIRSLKQHQHELAELGQKAAWAEMARKVAHEIKNPLTPIQLSAEHILRVFEDGRGDFEAALRESISYIVSEVEALRRIALDFLDASREPLPRHEPFDLDELVRETVEPYRKLLAERIIIARETAGFDWVMTGDRAKFKIALRNLLTNAIESIHGPGRIRTRVEGRPDELVLAIEDSGEGMDREILDRVFEPYFSTKDVGTGLGLPIAKKIVEDHGGTIHVSSRAGRGTAILIRIPRPRP